VRYFASAFAATKSATAFPFGVEGVMMSK